VAEDIGGAGAAALKRTATDAVNAYFAPIRARRARLAKDRGHLRNLLREGNALADTTLREVRAAMNGLY
jgi:tryptophanyl-tRNA synthetase